MKTLIFYAAFVVALIMMSSCEKVIEYDLNESSSRYVIEGSISDQAGNCRVKVSKSANFTESNNFPVVNSALVSITDNNGIKTELIETEPGIYSSSTLKGYPGNTYTLRVSVGNESFTGTSTMPESVSFDSIAFSKINAIGGSKKVPVPVYNDPENKSNYYRFIEKVNREKLDAVFVRDDVVTNGRTVRQPLFDFSDESAETGDEIEIVMMCIDAKVYEYFFSLSQVSGGGGPNQTGTPANPVSNLSGNALGYFSAHTQQIKKIVVP